MDNKQLENVSCNKSRKVSYNIIYADPPWMQKKGGIRKLRPNQGRELDYKTMSIDDIKSFLSVVKNNFSADKCNFFVWTIDKFLASTETMMDELGFKLHARIIWDKTNGICPAFTIRFSHEYLLWFYEKGSMYPVNEHKRGVYRDVIQEGSTVHSRKPEIAYKMIEDMFPEARKLELFARNKRDGWDSWGDEVECDVDIPTL